MNKTISLQFWLLLGILLCAGFTIHWLQHSSGSEPVIERKSLREFPAQLGQWNQFGGDQRFDNEIEKALQVSDYVRRDYISSSGKTVNLYIGYYLTQRTGATYHSPLNCLPGSGWSLKEPARIKIKSSDGKEIEANCYTVENAGKQFRLIYWYQGRGRAVASEYWDKIYTVLDSMTQKRSDGSMVQIMAPMQENEAETTNSITAEFASQMITALPAFIPN